MEYLGKICYGNEKENLHIDEIEKGKKGYYGRYVGNNSTTPEFSSLEALFNYYTDNKYWLNVIYETNTGTKVLKDIQKLLIEDGKVFSSDVFKVENEKIIIKIIKCFGSTYYWKEIFNLDTNERNIIIKLID